MEGGRVKPIELRAVWEQPDGRALVKDGIYVTDSCKLDTIHEMFLNDPMGMPTVVEIVMEGFKEE